MPDVRTLLERNAELEAEVQRLTEALQSEGNLKAKAWGEGYSEGQCDYAFEAENPYRSAS